MVETISQEISTEALRNGDRAEFAKMVDAYSAPIYRLGLRMLGNEQDAEDVLQNTFLSALTHLPSFEGRSSVLTWLYRIAVNEALMILRRGKPEVSIDDTESSDENENIHPTQFVDWGALPKDTADTLNLTEANVKVRLLRARLMLREQLSYYYGERMKKEKSNG